MKTLFVILSLIAFHAFADAGSPLVAFARVDYSVPGHPGENLNVYADGRVETLTCPISGRTCRLTSTSKLDASELPVLEYNANQAANQPEVSKPGTIHCDAIGTKTVTYAAYKVTGKAVYVATVNKPCQYKYRNNAAEALVHQLDKLLPTEE